MSKPKIVAICGSSRFVDVMAVCAWVLERDLGCIVLSLHLLPSWYTSLGDHLAESQGVADQMDALHLQKIELADHVLIMNVGGYVGASTRMEIARAEQLGKEVTYFSDWDYSADWREGKLGLPDELRSLLKERKGG